MSFKYSDKLNEFYLTLPLFYWKKNFYKDVKTIFSQNGCDTMLCTLKKESKWEDTKKKYILYYNF